MKNNISKKKSVPGYMGQYIPGTYLGVVTCYRKSECV